MLLLYEGGASSHSLMTGSSTQLVPLSHHDGPLTRSCFCKRRWGTNKGLRLCRIAFWKRRARCMEWVEKISSFLHKRLDDSSLGAPNRLNIQRCLFFFIFLTEANKSTLYACRKKGSRRVAASWVPVKNAHMY